MKYKIKSPIEYKNANLHWSIYGSNIVEHNKNKSYILHDVCDIQVKHLPNEKEAIKYAKKILNRKYYMVRAVLECDCSLHAMHHRQFVDANKETVKTLKKIIDSGHNHE